MSTKIKIKLKPQILSRSVRETNTYMIHYPEHQPRTNSSLFEHSQHQLCVVEDHPCLICGRTRKDDKIVTEAHHVMRYACMMGIDWIQFGQRAQHLYNLQTGVNLGVGYDWNAVAQDPTLFVDSCANLIVLCPEHHRGESTGIHTIPMPDWLLQIAPKDNIPMLTK